MLSHIDPLFKTLFRKTENTDARQEIKREETAYVSKDSDEDRRRQYETPAYNDTAEVSIVGLISLLDDALEQDSQSSQEHGFSDMAHEMTDFPEDDDHIDSTQNDADDEYSKLPTSSKIAVSAYQSTASKIEGREYAGQRTPTLGDTAHVVTMEADDRNTIQQLREELRTMLREGVPTLTMNRTGTFFESLSQAIMDYRQSE